MAYTPHTWQCGETITQTNMNRMEEGIQEALECCDNRLVVTVSYQYDEQTEESQWVADHSAEEIVEAYNQGKTVIARRAVEGAMMLYRLYFISNASSYNFASFTNIEVPSESQLSVYSIRISDYHGYDEVTLYGYHSDLSE